MPGDRKHIEFIARGLILDQGACLLCVNRADGYAFLPGGHIEFGESAMEALLRELDEEAGLRPPAQTDMNRAPILCSEHVFTESGGARHHEFYVVFHVEHLLGADDRPLTRTTPPPSLEEKIAFEWVDLASIVTRDVRPIQTRAWLASLDQQRGLTWASSIDPG